MKDIKGFEGLYAVTSCGRVWSYKKQKFLSLNKNRNNGYYYVHLYKDGKCIKSKQVHRLLAETYLPNPDNLTQVNHKDENKEHNYLNNLEWCTPQYNVDYSLSKKVRCVETGIVYKSVSEAARQLNLKRSNIYKVIMNKRKHTGGYTFEYYTEDD